MELHNLKPAKGSIKPAKRAVGRGEGSKKGGTSTRGHKGAKSRSGYSKKIGFEGGQQPLQRRVPKFGFTSPNRVEYNGVNIDTIEALYAAKKIKGTVVKQDLIDNGLIQKKDLVKILGRGEVTVKLDITADAFSVSAKEAIEKAGGTANIIDR
jgi:large subunit ribosomal protein L15